MSSPAPELNERLAQAGQEQLAGLHRLGRLGAHIGAEILDQQAGGLGLVTKEVDAFTSTVGRAFEKAGALPTGWVEQPTPPSRGAILLLLFGGATAVTLLLLLLRAARPVVNVRVANGN